MSRDLNKERIASNPIYVIGILNGILNPDCILKVKLSFSQEITDTGEPENIEDATVTVVENGTRSIELHHNAGGEYISDVRAQKGFSYRVLADVDGYPVAEAEGTIKIAFMRIAAKYRKQSGQYL